MRILTLSNTFYARKIFDSLISPNVYLYTAMINAYSMHPDHDSAIRLYRDMVPRKRPQVSHFIYPDVLQSCPEVLGPNGPKMVYTQIVKTGYEEYPVVKTGLIDAYYKFEAGGLRVALKLFDEMSKRYVVTWTAMISGYTRSGEMESDVELFERMPDKDISSWRNVVTWTAMVSGYTRSGEIESDVELFERMPDKDIPS
ncbi:pentatricopeptide repeat-containing protein [Tanacetum coccineum]|uniref:Pentatricopeptide repeat-containing protein n=1 Tax=Tanacetum coccineum TaxID=301880 RepID=A0ABQ4WKG8_9ASTR